MGQYGRSKPLMVKPDKLSFLPKTHMAGGES